MTKSKAIAIGEKLRLLAKPAMSAEAYAALVAGVERELGITSPAVYNAFQRAAQPVIFILDEVA